MRVLWLSLFIALWAAVARAEECAYYDDLCAVAWSADGRYLALRALPPRSRCADGPHEADSFVILDALEGRPVHRTGSKKLHDAAAKRYGVAQPAQSGSGAGGASFAASVDDAGELLLSVTGLAARELRRFPPAGPAAGAASGIGRATALLHGYTWSQGGRTGAALVRKADCGPVAPALSGGEQQHCIEAVTVNMGPARPAVPGREALAAAYTDRLQSGSGAQGHEDLAAAGIDVFKLAVDAYNDDITDDSVRAQIVDLLIKLDPDRGARFILIDFGKKSFHEKSIAFREKVIETAARMAGKDFLYPLQMAIVDLLEKKERSPEERRLLADYIRAIGVIRDPGARLLFSFVVERGDEEARRAVIASLRERAGAESVEVLTQILGLVAARDGAEATRAEAVSALAANDRSTLDGVVRELLAPAAALPVSARVGLLRDMNAAGADWNAAARPAGRFEIARREEILTALGSGPRGPILGYMKTMPLFRAIEESGVIVSPGRGERVIADDPDQCGLVAAVTVDADGRAVAGYAPYDGFDTYYVHQGCQRGEQECATGLKMDGARQDAVSAAVTRVGVDARGRLLALAAGEMLVVEPGKPPQPHRAVAGCGPVALLEVLPGAGAVYSCSLGRGRSAAYLDDLSSGQAVELPPGELTAAATLKDGTLVLGYSADAARPARLVLRRGSSDSAEGSGEGLHASRILFLAPVRDGMFVGTEHGLVFRAPSGYYDTFVTARAGVSGARGEAWFLGGEQEILTYSP